MIVFDYLPYGAYILNIIHGPLKELDIFEYQASNLMKLVSMVALSSSVNPQTWLLDSYNPRHPHMKTNFSLWFY